MYIRSYDGLGQKDLPVTHGTSGLSDRLEKEIGISPASLYKLADLVFFARFPSLMGTKIQGKRNLELEYNKIYNQLLNPSSASLPTGFVIDLTVPEINPTTDYSKTEEDLGQLAHPGVRERARVWELAIFNAKFRFMFSTKETAMADGKLVSYVSMVSVTFDKPRFAVFIAKHLWDNSHDLTLEKRDRNTWGQIHLLVRNHAYFHLEIYRRIAGSMGKVLQELFSRLLPLPIAEKQLAVSKEKLDEYLNSLGDFLITIGKHEFWKKTCDWEKKDYPELGKKIKRMPGSFIPTGLKVDCGSEPKLPDIIPLLPAPIKAK